MTHLVYIAGLRGPEPQKWPEILTDMKGKVIPHLAPHELSDAEEKLSLDVLRKLYPPPPSEHA